MPLRYNDDYFNRKDETLDNLRFFPNWGWMKHCKTCDRWYKIDKTKPMIEQQCPQCQEKESRMPIEDRDWYRGNHPPTCTCIDCVNKRVGGNKAKAKETVVMKNRSIDTMRIVQSLLVGVSILFGIIGGLSILAWFAPTAFSQLTNTINRVTGNPDIQLNANRISQDPVLYAIIFIAIALILQWVSRKFYR